MKILFWIHSILLLWHCSMSLCQSCTSGKFVVANGNTEYLSIVSPKDVKMCGYDNVCEVIEAKPVQTLNLDQGRLSLSDSNSIDLPDSSPTNELQTISLTQGRLSLSNANYVDLPDNSSTNELQTLSVNEGKLVISGTNSVDLPDNSPTNELQTLSLDGGNLTISQGNKVDISSAVMGAISTPWVPLQVVGSCKSSQYSTPMVKRVGDIVFMRGWLDCSTALSNYAALALLPADSRFTPGSWHKLVVNRQDAGGNSIAFVSVTGSNNQVTLWNSATSSGYTFIFDGVFYFA